MPQSHAFTPIGVVSVVLWPVIWLSLWYLVRVRGVGPNRLARRFWVTPLLLWLVSELIPAFARVVSPFAFFLHFWLSLFTAYILEGQGNGWWPLPGNSNSEHKTE